MKVTITTKKIDDQVEKKGKGMFSKSTMVPTTTYWVICKVTLSAEEHAIADEHQLWKIKIDEFVSWRYIIIAFATDEPIGESAMNPLPVDIANMCDEKGTHYSFKTAVEAYNKTIELRQKVLPLLKDQFEAAAVFKPGNEESSETFDL